VRGTLAERILDAPAGEYVDRRVDRAFCHDGTGVLTLEALRSMGVDECTCPDRTYIIFDHISPANNSTTSGLQHEVREFAAAQGVHFSEIGGGICHQVMSEGIVLPGEVVVGADSHSCTMGAFGAFATGVGATDMAGILASGSTWFRVPSTIAVVLTGRAAPPVEPKDAALACVGRLRADGATYQALEFTGEGVGGMSVDGRLTLCNMAVETGAKAGLCYADETTGRYLAGFGHQGIEAQVPDDCSYADEIEIDLSDLPPLVAVPHDVDNVCEVGKVAGTPIDQVFVGTCTNGRYEDLRRFAAIVKGKKVAVRTVVVPASRKVLMQALGAGIYAEIVEAGCVVCPPGCGPCLGAHMGVLGEGEVCLSTANRNFRNRMGVGGAIYLSSVATAGASALTGEITVPEDGHVR